MVNLPFDEIKESDKKIRIFKFDTISEDLKWHWDEEDRYVELIEESDWKFQFDDDLPIKFPNRLIIPSMMWHRVIKGQGDLKIAISRIDLNRFSLSE
jgi:hypothetical protein